MRNNQHDDWMLLASGFSASERHERLPPMHQARVYRRGRPARAVVGLVLRRHCGGQHNESFMLEIAACQWRGTVTKTSLIGVAKVLDTTRNGPGARGKRGGLPGEGFWQLPLEGNLLAG